MACSPARPSPSACCSALVRLPRRLFASIIAFGAATLVVALTFELMGEAIEEGSVLYAMGGLFAGALIYIVLAMLLGELH